MTHSRYASKSTSKSILQTGLLCFIFLMAQFSLAAATYHVKPTGSDGNTGASWGDAYATVQQALSSASSGDEIWVAAGTYYPTTGTDRTISFIMKPGVAIYGGFPATGTPTMAARDWNAHLTTLSGDIGTSGNNADNSYHVVFNDNNDLDATAILDGFVITGGNASVFSNPHHSGGGMFNISSSPTISNSTFSDNSANYNGGGMYNISSSPTISNSTFSDNSTTYNGGGMYNTLSSSPSVSNSTFNNNTANNGGGMYNFSSSPMVSYSTFSGNSASSSDRGGGGMFNNNSSPTVSYSIFSDNTANVFGGGMYNFDSSPMVSNSTFSDNTAAVGGGMYNEDSSSPTVSNSAFSSNTASVFGGGMHNEDSSSPTVSNSTFSGNTAVAAGGGMYNTLSSSPAVSNSTFSGNTAHNGGGMYNFYSIPAVSNSTFSGNTAGHGGGMYNEDSSPSVSNTTFSENTASDGGGMFNYNNSSPMIENSEFNENIATSGGGGMYNEDSFPSIENSEFNENTATNKGGGMYNSYGSSPTIENSEFNENSAEAGGGMCNDSSFPTVSNSIFSNNLATQFGGGMYNFSFSSPMVSNSTFSNNSANAGGGMYNDDSSPAVEDTEFSENSATYGGGMLNSSSSPTVENSTFSYNSATASGGGMYSSYSSPTVGNSTFSDNTAASGGGMYNFSSSPIISNSILWGDDNGSEVFNNNNSNPTITYSIVRDGYAGVGNKDEDPRFIDAAAGDLHLLACSPAIDAGNDGDAPALDKDGNSRYDAIAGGMVADMGAFEFQAGGSDEGCNEPPVAACKNITVNANNNCMGIAVAADFDNNSSDPDGDELSFSVSPEGPYSLGETTVTLTVSDGQETDECTATITVIDEDKPQWVSGCPDNFEIYTDQFTCLALVEQEMPEANDACLDVIRHRVRMVDPVTLENMGPWQGGWTTGDLSMHLPIGTYKVRWRAQDLSGNRKHCNQFITVKEVLPCPYVQLEDGVGCEDGNNGWYDAATETFWLESENCHNSTSSASDEYAFIQRELCGNGSITVKVASLESSQASNGWAGIMMRESNAPLAPSVNLATNKSSNHRKNVRATYGASVTSQQSSAFNRHWLRIVRNGNNFRGYASSNGTSWFLKFSHTVVMGSCIQVGMTLSSYVSSGDHTVSFEHVAFEGNVFNLQEDGNQDGLQTSNSERTFTAFPNPTADLTTVSMAGFIDQKGTLDVVNAFGQILITHQLGMIESSKHDLDLSSLPGGVYTIRLRLETGEAEMIQIVKQ